jgi:hypothetical protein
VSVWTVPITWGNGAVTASQMNSLRDNLLFLKGWADLITGGTTADVGTATYLEIHRGASGNDVLRAFVGTEAQPRYTLTAGGREDRGPGGATAPDTVFQRSGVGEMQIIDNLRVNQVIATNSAQALNLEGNGTDGGWAMFAERQDVVNSNINPNHGVIYLRDQGGKSQFVARFNTGNPIPFATQV